MSRATLSMAVWTVYAMAVGVMLLAVPNVLLGLFRIDETSDPWVRVVGAVVILLAIYYGFMVREESTPMYRATVIGRGIVALLLTVLAFTSGPWQLVLFAIVDVLGAVWTQLSLRSAEPAIGQR